MTYEIRKPEELAKLHPLERELMAKEDLQEAEVVSNVALEKELMGLMGSGKSAIGKRVREGAT